MKRAVPAGYVLAAWVGAAPALAVPADMGHGPGMVTTDVGMGYLDFRPQTVHVVAGDHVRWTNGSVRAHTVTADDGRFDTSRLLPGDTFERMFETAGSVPYHCSLHVAMRGTVIASTLLLDVPVTAAAPGQPYPLGGRTALAAGTTVRLQADAGDGFADVGTAVVGADGRFAARVRATRTAAYRAVAAADASPPVTVRVLDRALAVTSRPIAARGDRVGVRVTPPDPGATVVLQLRIPERFGWWPAQAIRLDRRSRATFTIRLRRRLAARVRLTLADGATPLATSRTFHLGR